VADLQGPLIQWLLERVVLAAADEEEVHANDRQWPPARTILAPICWLERVIDQEGLTNHMEEALESATLELKVLIYFF